MGYSEFMFMLGGVLACLGLVLFFYLLRLYLDYHSERDGGRSTEPEYVREINERLTVNNVETERDLPA